MFDKLEDLIVRLEEILRDLSEPEVANDSKRFQKPGCIFCVLTSI